MPWRTWSASREKPTAVRVRVRVRVGVRVRVSTWSASREKPTAVAAAWARALIVGTLLPRSKVSGKWYAPAPLTRALGGGVAARQFDR